MEGPPEPGELQVRNLIVQMKNKSLEIYRSQNQSVRYMRYTKLPEHEFHPNVNWPVKGSYVLQPRLRRIVTINDEENIVRLAQCLINELGIPEKIATIAELDENAPSNSNINQDLNAKRRAVKSTPNTGREVAKAPNSWVSATTKHAKIPDLKSSAKQENSSSKKSLLNSKRITSGRKILSRHTSPPLETKARKEQDVKISKSDVGKNTKVKRYSNVNNVSKKKDLIRVGPTIEQESGTDSDFKSVSNNVTKASNLKTYSFIEQSSNGRGFHMGDKFKSNNFLSKRNSLNKIYVEKEITPQTPPKHPSTRTKFTNSKDSFTEPHLQVSDRNVGTDPEPEKKDALTDVTIEQHNSDTQTDDMGNTQLCTIEISNVQSHFDSLEIPNVTLLKDKSDEPKEFIEFSHSHSFSDLHVPSVNISPQLEVSNSKIENSTTSSYIIGRATLTYTTKQKFDFRVVSNNDSTVSSTAVKSLAYPMNVVSLFKNEIGKKHLDLLPIDIDQKKKKIFNDENEECRKGLVLVDDSFTAHSSKFVKPSDIIGSISVNNELLGNDAICEQFMRELNFIDSFFESLQYLENCSLMNKSLGEKKLENLVTKSGFNVPKFEYDSLLSKFDNETNIDDIETMASKSVCLLNLLIRDEQRRAKNLLFVLKMREDALKDFTKSQILWLENKKKHVNIDITALKKKQRGALLKLQQECGEMQRMRKALLSLSEKRKLALMKTKKNIELKMKSNVSPDQIVLNKKKLKRSFSSERPQVPLKCFDLSSSGCEENTAPRLKSEPAVEQCTQTSRLNSPAPCEDQTIDTAAENYVIVDGAYLNIIFHNLKLPEIFSRGKSYEVNEDALKSIVNSANSNSAIVDNSVVEKFVSEIKNREQDRDRSSTPSTARSLVEEFDQYYKDLTEEDLKTPSLRAEFSSSPLEEACGSDLKLKEDDSVHAILELQAGVDTCDLDDEDDSDSTVNSAARGGYDEAHITQEVAGPLPVPVGAAPSAASSCHVAAPNSNVIFLAKSKSTWSSVTDHAMSDASSVAQAPALSSPVQNEAEELMRQQLAIEREIKALEQQQCQLLVVREIPDKPPPPYTPPADLRVTEPRRFQPEDDLDEKIRYNILELEECSTLGDVFDVFISDLCVESVQKYRKERSDKPWDAYNLLPQKPAPCRQQLAERTSYEVREILTGYTQPVSGTVAGMGSRRSDHIDDILFAEWRRCEPEWTSLHTDEAAVKGQIFDSIFQHILSETIDAYKETVLGESGKGSRGLQKLTKRRIANTDKN